MRTARQLHAALTASTAALFADDDFPAFHARQRAIWDEIAARPRIHARVNAMLRANLNPAGPVAR